MTDPERRCEGLVFSAEGAAGRVDVSGAPITRFDGEYRWLSNFWRCDVWACGETYPTVEHAYQAMKTRDLDARQMIRDQPTPGEAQWHGRCLALRTDWKDIRIGVMERLVRDKFTRHGDLGLLLRETGRRELVEGNDWGDRFWGVSDGAGLNHLGCILMRVRAELLRDASRIV